ncbi:SspB-related isopeptide-forming adhesin [Pseudolactococcus insecticola]|uniref:Gram-positive cocci surface proteins LPxTG domain-containing protein n=1 Tax=Pseudolactococcus insecticola TaxID=2709158 RepID=A0A6A0B9Z7_9LACT|nr:SspB-related isopeptide-forming adhesin [Lactococcus insecticola]GFH41278.1 hypothetical protein Hs20B_16760 [Lactococcus insecticola]
MNKKTKFRVGASGAALLGGIGLVAVSQNTVHADDEVGDVRVYVTHDALDNQIERAYSTDLDPTQDADVKIVAVGDDAITKAIATAKADYASQTADMKAKIDKYVSDLQAFQDAHKEVTDAEALVDQFNAKNQTLINQLVAQGVTVSTSTKAVPYSQSTGSDGVNTYLTNANSDVASDAADALAKVTAQNKLESDLATATNKFNVDQNNLSGVTLSNTGTVEATTSNVSTYYDSIIAKAKAANTKYNAAVADYSNWVSNYSTAVTNVQNAKQLALQTLEGPAYLNKTVASSSLADVKTAAVAYITNNPNLGITATQINAMTTSQDIVDLIAANTLISGTILPVTSYSSYTTADKFNAYVSYITFNSEIQVALKSAMGVSTLPATFTAADISSVIAKYNADNGTNFTSISAVLTDIVSQEGISYGSVTTTQGPVPPTLPVVTYKTLVYTPKTYSVSIPTYTYDATAWEASYQATKPKKPSLTYHLYDIISQPENSADGTNRDESTAYGDSGTKSDPYVALKGQTIGVKMDNDDIPAYRGGEKIEGTQSNDMVVFHNYVMEMKVPTNATVDLTLTKKRALADGFNVSYDDVLHILTFTATTDLLTKINLNKDASYDVPTPIAFITLNDDDATYAFNFKTTINDEYQTTSNTIYFETSSADPTKHNYNTDTGVKIDGYNLLPSDVNEYHITWDLNQYKGSNVDSLMMTKGLYYIDDYPEGAVSVKTPKFIDSNGNAVSGISYTIYDSIADAPADVQQYVKDAGVKIDGKFILYSVDNVADFNKNYIQTGNTVTIVQPMVTLKNPSVEGGSYSNVAYQIDFGNLYKSNTVTNTVPKIDPQKDVIARVGDLTSLAGSEIQLNQVFDYRLEGAELPKNLAYGVESYEFYDLIDPNYDQYDGIYMVEATTDIVLKSGRVIKAGSEITKYTTQELRRTSDDTNLQTVYIYFDPEFLDQIDWSKSEFGADVYVQVKRVGAKEGIPNQYKNIIQGVEYLSNKVTTNTYDYGVANLIHYVDENGDPLLATIAGTSKVKPDAPIIPNATLVKSATLDKNGDWVITYNSLTSSTDILNKFDQLDDTDKKLQENIDEVAADLDAAKIDLNGKIVTVQTNLDKETAARIKTDADAKAAADKALAAEAEARAKADADEAVARAKADADEAAARAKAIADEAAARAKAVADEAAARAKADADEAAARAKAIADEAAARAKADADEAAARAKADKTLQANIDAIFDSNLDYVRVMSDADYQAKGFPTPAGRVLGTATYDSTTKLWSIPVYIETGELVDAIAQLKSIEDAKITDLTASTTAADKTLQANIDAIFKSNLYYTRVMSDTDYKAKGFTAPAGYIAGDAVQDPTTKVWSIPVYKETGELVDAIAQLKSIEDAKITDLTASTTAADKTLQANIDAIFKSNLDYTRVMSDADYKAKGFTAPAGEVLGTATYDTTTKLWSIPVYKETGEVVDAIAQLKSIEDAKITDLTTSTSAADKALQTNIDNLLTSTLDYTRTMTKADYEKNGFTAPAGRVLGQAVYNETTKMYSIPVYIMTGSAVDLVANPPVGTSLTTQTVTTAVSSTTAPEVVVPEDDTFSTFMIGTVSVAPVVINYSGYELSSVTFDNARGGWILTYKKTVKKA